MCFTCILTPVQLWLVPPGFDSPDCVFQLMSSWWSSSELLWSCWGWMFSYWSVVGFNLSGFGVKLWNPTIFPSATGAENIYFTFCCFSNKLHKLRGHSKGFMWFKLSVEAVCTTSTSWLYNFTLWIVCLFLSFLSFFFLPMQPFKNRFYWSNAFPFASVRTCFLVHFWSCWGQIEINAHQIKAGSTLVLLFVVQPQSQFRKE